VAGFAWDFGAVPAPAVLVLGLLLAAGRPALPRVQPEPRRGILAVAAGAIAAAALYSLAAPWLASRRVDDAYASLARGDLAGAASNARSAHNLNPLSVDALLAWGAAEASRGNMAGAGHLYTEAISLHPDHCRPGYYRARLVARSGLPKAASLADLY